MLLAGFPLRGRWQEDFFHNDHPVVVELGCGKGEYTVGMAEKYADRNFIGIDWKGARLWRGSKTVAEKQMPNVGFVRTMVDHVEKVFSTEEVAGIWITFPDPQVHKERLRLTSPVFLAKYRNILKPGAPIHLKTDDRFLFSYTLDVISRYGYKLIFETDDLYGSGSSDEILSIKTFYEQRWLDMGKKICYLKFQMSV